MSVKGNRPIPLTETEIETEMHAKAKNKWNLVKNGNASD